MERYISADKLIEFLKRTSAMLKPDMDDFLTRDNMLLNFRQYVALQPTENVAEVKRGEWLNFARDFRTAECSKCGELYDVSDHEPTEEYFNAFKQLYNFCPNCGADMRGKKDDR